MEDHGKPRNLDDFAMMNHGILRTGSQNFQNFPWKTVGPTDYMRVDQEVMRINVLYLNFFYNLYISKK